MGFVVGSRQDLLVLLYVVVLGRDCIAACLIKHQFVAAVIAVVISSFSLFFGITRRFPIKKVRMLEI